MDLTLEEQLVYDDVVAGLQTIDPERMQRASTIAVAAVESHDPVLLQAAFDAMRGLDRPAVWQ